MTKSRNRRYVLIAVVLLLATLTAAILLEVMGTILFAITVAYVLLPVQRWLVRRGLTARTAAVVASLGGFVAAVAVFAPIFLTLYFRVDELIALVTGLPPEITVTVLEETFVFEVQELQFQAIGALQSIAFSIAAELPVLAIKFALFVILVFALLLKSDAAATVAITPIPHEYRYVAYALGRRAQETLYAIYVLQVATAVATLLIGYPLFALLGHDAAFTIALIAAILQFVPIIGPSLVVAPLALYQAWLGDVSGAILTGVLGVVLVAWLPDIAVRPHLARRSVNLPGSLYFVGFTGGLFTLGAIGIVVGPLIVAVFVEALSLLAEDVNGDRRPTDDTPETVGHGAVDSSFDPTEPSTDGGGRSVTDGGDTSPTESAGADEPPATDETPTTVDTPTGDDSLATDDTSTGDDSPATDDTPTGDDSPATDDTPTGDDSPATDDTPTTD